MPQPARLIPLLLLVPAVAHARTEYAAKEKRSCHECHVTPWGGGPRVVFGKAYGTHSQPGSLTAGNDLFYGDLRTIAYFPLENTSERTNGVATMEAAAAANIPVSQSENGAELRVLTSFNLAPLSGAQLREGYARYRPGPREDPSPLYFTVGHFYVPFGLITDEHRTYTRIQTGMTLNHFHTGAAASWLAGRDTQFDLALVNDFQTGGSFNSADLTWAGVFNFRWNPSEAPFLVGTSLNYERMLREPDPYAFSLYFGLSFDRIWPEAVSGSLLLETVLAKNWNSPEVNTGQVNPSLSAFFISPSAPEYATAVATRSSLGNLAQLKLNLSPQWTLLYKFDYLALDSDDLGSNFTRHGIGFETYIGPHVILNTRVEFATVPDAAAPDDLPLAAQNDVYAMLRVWL